MGRHLRHPNGLLRRPDVQEAGDLQAYHKRLLVAMKKSYECAELARRREQERQARYYNRKVRQRREFRPGDLVWVHNPPQGRKATKFVHQWMGPMKVVEPTGYENHVLTRLDRTGKEETVIAHESFMVSYHYPVTLLEQVAHDIDEQLAHEDQSERSRASATTTALIGTATAAPTRTAATSGRAAPGRPTKRCRTTVADPNDVCDGVDGWWNAEDDVDATVPGSISWNMSCIQQATWSGGEPETRSSGRTTTAASQHGGCPSVTTKNASPMDGSWKTHRVRKSCNVLGETMTANEQTADFYGGQVATSGTWTENRACGPREWRDRQHNRGGLEPAALGLRAHFEFGELASKPNSATCAWEQARDGQIDDSEDTDDRRLDDCGSVNDSGAADSGHVVCESFEGCDVRGGACRRKPE
ncbi:hypothetical protein PHMEG_00020627 [Phytophthora megakarya]|uniref:Uncharacterized protein n=1 Tax=Phytophthora megakarya TaxID=4795 RepID=A0A225VNW6_9STRA|nr:hypothetical protein PHMEG_00020627 [Phytophthora megakarya]